MLDLVTTRQMTRHFGYTWIECPKATECLTTRHVLGEAMGQEVGCTGHLADLWTTQCSLDSGQVSPGPTWEHNRSGNSHTSLLTLKKPRQTLLGDRKRGAGCTKLSGSHTGLCGFVGASHLKVQAGSNHSLLLFLILRRRMARKLWCSTGCLQWNS